jgi:dTDP-4-dehydrorhamnose reductase
LTGKNGYLAKSIFAALNNQHEFTLIGRDEFDLSDSKATNSWFANKSFDAVVHTAVAGGSRLVADTGEVTEKNLRMHYNILANRDKFGRYIGFGSGAEIFFPDTPYGLSKRVIANSINETPNFHNIRIFGVFDENELPTRFIKANLLRYMKKEPMQILTNKVMDFYYMKDLVCMVQHFLVSSNPPKEANCSYATKHTLLNIADFINSLSNHSVEIEITNSKNLELYCGEPTVLPINTVGLADGIRATYQRLIGDIQHG